ncbi:MAG: glycosidase [Bacteroidales bacterium]|nr:glycosidase [Bacteroidales bacterium]
MLKRYANNPIIVSSDTKPLNDSFVILGIFNPAAFQMKGKIYLLLRIAEQPKSVKGKLRIPIVKKDSDQTQLGFFEVYKNHQDLIIDDVRKYKWKGREYLSSLSHFRLAESEDGIHFKIAPTAWMLPDGENENFGIEDARITQIDQNFYVNYTAASDDGYVTSMVKTSDFNSYERMGIIFPPLNKDVAIFPEKIKGKYFALHRPEVMPFGKPSIWIASSPDLIHWGNHHVLLRPNNGQWNNDKIGGGPPPIKTPEGWLVIYHGVTINSPEGKEFYSLSAMLLDLEDPSKIIANKTPILFPEEDYETSAFVKNVVFSNGAVYLEKTKELLVYYGAGDESIGLAKVFLPDFLVFLTS